MTAYFDFGFLAVLLLRTPGSPLAWQLAKRFSAPFPINYLTSLQIQVLLARGLLQGNPQQRAHAEAGARLWTQYSREGVFALDPAPWENAFQLAHNWLRAASAPVPQPTQYLHAALAGVSGATHFLSFDPRSRTLAAANGLKLLPEKL
jgi:hypothetical protein